MFIGLLLSKSSSNEDTALLKGENVNDNINVNMDDFGCIDNQNTEDLVYLKAEEIDIEDVYRDENCTNGIAEVIGNLVFVFSICLYQNAYGR